MREFLLVFIGGGLGSVLRFIFNRLIPVGSFPYSTLTVNMVGIRLRFVRMMAIASIQRTSSWATAAMTWRPAITPCQSQAPSTAPISASTRVAWSQVQPTLTRTPVAQVPAASQVTVTWRKGRVEFNFSGWE